MKIFSKILFLAIFTFSLQTVSAQLMNKKSVLSDLGNTEGVKLDSKQQKDYDRINNDLADNLLKVDSDKNKSKNDRDKEIDNLFDKRDNDIDNLFGKDSKYNETKKSMRKTSNKMRRKMKLAKFAL